MRKTRILSLALCAILILSFAAGCGGNEKPASKKSHDRETYVITGNEEGKIEPHNFVAGKCTMCDETTIFRQEPMASTKNILNYDAPAGHKGTIVEIWYKTRAYGVESKHAEYEGKLHIVKRAYVYLPAGYDANDTSKKYNVLYKMHGNKLNEGYWFRSGSYASESAWSAYTAGYGTENMLDWMYDNLDIEDTIIVTPTLYNYYYNDKQGDELGGDAEVGNLYYGYIDPDFERIEEAVTKEEGADGVWYMEFMNDLMPYIVENFNTYAASTADADLIAARDHVGFTGLSRGGGICSGILNNCFPYVSYVAWESGGGPGQAFFDKYNSEWKDKYPINFLFLSCGSSENPVGTAQNMLNAKTTLGL
ncbi:MAG: hypothetical protein J6Z23_00915, partial [Lachnospiraceae bacterium]|nr:hypothetical protein [Lachnospiraceae bacterium]